MVACSKKPYTTESSFRSRVRYVHSQVDYESAKIILSYFCTFSDMILGLLCQVLPGNTAVGFLEKVVYMTLK